MCGALHGEFTEELPLAGGDVDTAGMQAHGIGLCSDFPDAPGEEGE